MNKYKILRLTSIALSNIWNILKNENTISLICYYMTWQNISIASNGNFSCKQRPVKWNDSIRSDR